MTFKSFLYVVFAGSLVISDSLKAFCDCPEKNQLFVQDPATPMMEGMIYFHNLLMFFIVFTGVFVFYMLFYAMYTFHSERNAVPAQFSHNSPLEIIWTILPAIILLFIAIPSFTLLYSLDELIDPQLTVKVIGHQWYWSYEISDYIFREGANEKKLDFDAYMVTEDNLLNTPMVGCRLLLAKPRLLLPTETHIRLLVASADVLHSWAVPSFGIKIDACPGRLSQGSLFINRMLDKKPAIFFGQCSEICGVNHGFMPITILAVSPEVYKSAYVSAA
jgi:cytochrome c oxidase subunit 2